MPDDSATTKGTAPLASATPTRRISVPQRPATEAGRYRSTDVIEETAVGGSGLIHIRQRTIDETIKELDQSKLTQEDLEKIAVRGGPAAEDVKALFRRQGDRKDGLVIDRIQKYLGFGLREIRVSLDSVVTYSFSAQVHIPDSGKPIPLKVQVLRCGPPLFRVFLLSNAPIQVLGPLENAVGLENRLLNWLTNPRSIILPGNPGDMRYIYLTAPIIDDILGIMQKRFIETIPSRPPAVPSSASSPVVDLPAPAQKPVDPLQALFGPKPFVPHREEKKHPKEKPEARKEEPTSEKKEPPKQETAAATPAGKRVITNTLGITLEDLEGRKKVSNESELRAMFNTPYSLYVITTESRRIIIVAEETRFASFLGEHPEFLPASELENGDIIYLRTKAGPAPERITEIDRVESGESVVLRRIRVEGERMIFADGFAVSGMVSLLPDAIVDTPMGKKEADKLKRGNEVISFSDGEYGASGIANTFKVETGFRGIEIELKSGMRLLVVPMHPHTFADKCPAVLEYADTARFMEVEYENGKKRYYVLVKPRAGGMSPGFSLSPMENTLQIMEEPCPVQEEKPVAVFPMTAEAEPLPSAPAEATPEIPPAEEPQSRQALATPSAGQVLEEAFEAMRKYASDLGGKQPSSSEEHIFGENIAILASSGNRTYLLTNADDWYQAKKALEEHLSSETEKIMLTEIQTSYARRTIPLPSGGQVTITVRPVGKSTIYGGPRGHSDTLEMMIPQSAIDAAAEPGKRKRPKRSRTLKLKEGARKQSSSYAAPWSSSQAGMTKK